MCYCVPRFSISVAYAVVATVDRRPLAGRTFQMGRSMLLLPCAAAASSIFAYELQNAAHISRYCLVVLLSVCLLVCLWLRVLGKAGNPPPIRSVGIPSRATHLIYVLVSSMS